MSKATNKELFNVSDSKWGHPEFVGGGWWFNENGTDQDPNILEKMPAEEVEALREPFRNPMRKVMEAKKGTDYANVEWKDYYTEHGCPEEEDAPPLHIIVGMSAGRKKKRAVYFSVVGGGLTGCGTAELGSIGAGIWTAISMSKMDMISVAFEYRTAPADKYPAAVNDCHAAYMWMIEHADELGIDTDRIVIAGASTGGHLALSLAFRLKRYDWCGAPMPRGLILQVPVIDDVADTDSYLVSFRSPESGKVGMWDHESTRTGYLLWLGERFGDPQLPAEAVPNRATLEDVKGLPPVWIPVEAEFEVGRDSIYRLVHLLHRAHIFCDLHVWGGTNHCAAAGATDSEFTRRIMQTIAGALRDALTYDFRRPWLNE